MTYKLIDGLTVPIGDMPTEMPTVANIAALRNKVGVATGNHVHVSGYTTVSDGGGGIFIWDGTSIAADDGGIIIQPTGLSTGRWKRLFSGPLNVLWFGAKRDNITDNKTIIQNMVTNAISPTGGGALYFPGGDGYYLLSDYLLLSNYTNLKIYSDSAAVIGQPKNKRAFILDTCSNVEISGLHFIGTIIHDGGDPGGGNIEQTSITLETCSQVNIHHCTFENLGGYGVTPHTFCSDITVQNNNFLRTMAGCQAGGGGGFTLNDIRIIDNIFIAYNPAISDGYGNFGSDDQIACFGGLSGSITISRNYIDKQGIDGYSQAKVQASCITIESDDLDGYIRDLIITDNTCVNNYSTHATHGRASIYIFGPNAPFNRAAPVSNAVISNNIIRLGNVGIFFNYLGLPASVINVTMEGNLISDIRTTPAGISPMGIQYTASGGGNLASRMIVRGNSIEDTDDAGISLGPVCEAVIIEGNTVKNAGRAATSIGIFVSNTLKDYLIANNQVFGASGSGIAITSGESIRIIGNLAAGCGSAGFAVNNTIDSIFQGNISRNNGERGIFITSNSDLSIVNNNAYGNASDGIVTVGTNTGLRIIGNSFHNNVGHGISYQDVNGTALIEGNYLVSNSSPFVDFSTTSTYYMITNPDSIQAYGKSGIAQITNTDVSNSAAIAYSKLALSNSIVNADINSAAAIAVSKLAAGSNGQVLETVSGVPTWSTAGSTITLAGDVTGTVGANTVVRLTGSSNVITLPSTNVLTWDSSGPTIGARSGTPHDIALTVNTTNSSLTFFDTTSLVAFFNWNSGHPYLQQFNGTGFQIIANGGNLSLESVTANIDFRPGNISKATITTDGYMRLGDGTAPTDNLELVFGSISWENTAVAPKIYQKDTQGVTGASMTIQAQNASGTLSTGGSLTLQSGAGNSVVGSVVIKTGTTTRISIAGNTGVVTITNLGTGIVHADSSGNLTSSSITVGTDIGGGTDGQVLQTVTTTPTWSTYAGDVTGKPTASTVVAITGAAGSVPISSSGNIITWAAATTAPGIKQTNVTTNSAIGATLTIQSQNATGTSATGGDLTLTTGTGTSAAGTLRLQVGGSSAIIFNTQVSVLLSLWAWNFTLASPKIRQDTDSTNNITAQTFTLQAQNASGTTSTGGTLALTSGTGTTAAGPVLLQTGGTTRLTANATGVVTIANLGTGVVHADSSGNLTSSLIVDADVSGSAAITGSKIASATTGALGVIQLATDLGGTATSPNVIRLTGSAGVISLPSTNVFTWDSSGPTIGVRSGVAHDIALTVNTTGSSITFFDTTNLIAFFNWNGGNPYLQQFNGTGFAIIATGGDLTLRAPSSQGINLQTNGSNNRVQISSTGAVTVNTFTAGVVLSSGAGLLSSYTGPSYSQLTWNGTSWVGIGIVTATLTDGYMSGTPVLNVNGTTPNTNQWIVPAATLGASRTIRLGTGGAVNTETITIVRLDTTANTLIVQNNPDLSTLYTFPVSVARAATFNFDGTNWALVSTISIN